MAVRDYFADQGRLQRELIVFSIKAGYIHPKAVRKKSLQGRWI